MEMCERFTRPTVAVHVEVVTPIHTPCASWERTSPVGGARVRRPRVLRLASQLLLSRPIGTTMTAQLRGTDCYVARAANRRGRLRRLRSSRSLSVASLGDHELHEPHDQYEQDQGHDRLCDACCGPRHLIASEIGDHFRDA